MPKIQQAGTAGGERSEPPCLYIIYMCIYMYTLLPVSRVLRARSGSPRINLGLMYMAIKGRFSLWATAYHTIKTLAQYLIATFTLYIHTACTCTCITLSLSLSLSCSINTGLRVVTIQYHDVVQIHPSKLLDHPYTHYLLTKKNDTRIFIGSWFL
jgi:hypothetical protein